jgi:chitin disaccharide deacetylase
MKRKLIINADDIGMHPAIDQAAMALAETGVVTSVSVMALGSPSSDAMRIFSGYGVDIGLHLDLTSEMANRLYDTDATIASLVLQAYCRQLNPQHIQEIVRGQIARFAERVGALPTFIDGHEHVHQLPVVRDALMDVLGEMSDDYRPYLRNTTPRRWRGNKAAIIGLLGARTLGRHADSAGHLQNTDFLGVYDFKRSEHIAQLWENWLQTLPDTGALLMCHPALLGQGGSNEFRHREYRFLASVEFEDMLTRHGVTTSNWKDSVGSNAIESRLALTA